MPGPTAKQPLLRARALGELLPGPGLGRLVPWAGQDPGGEPQDVERDQQHRAGETGAGVGDPVLGVLAALSACLSSAGLTGTRSGRALTPPPLFVLLVPCALVADPPRMPALWSGGLSSVHPR
jgi:hypothetical protein